MKLGLALGVNRTSGPKTAAVVVPTAYVQPATTIAYVQPSSTIAYIKP